MDNLNAFISDFGFEKYRLYEKSIFEDIVYPPLIEVAPECIPNYYPKTIKKSLEGNMKTPIDNMDKKLDIYSWAIIINAILNEEIPWKNISNPSALGERIRTGERPDLIKGKEYKIYRDLITRGWDQDPNQRPTAEKIVETLLKDEAMLPGVNKKEMREYQYKCLSNISSPLLYKIMGEKIKEQAREIKELKQKSDKKKLTISPVSNDDEEEEEEHK